MKMIKGCFIVVNMIGNMPKFRMFKFVIVVILAHFRGVWYLPIGGPEYFYTHLCESFFKEHNETSKYKLKMLTPLFLDFAIVPCFLRISVLILQYFISHISNFNSDLSY